MFISELFSQAVDFIWGIPLLCLLIGGGIYFLIASRLLPFKYLTHAIAVLRGKYDQKKEEGEINHFQALTGALAATIGMGNVSGVALALAAGGPGVLFWMWIFAFLGMITKFFTCALAVLYRGKNDAGVMQGGPMYVIREGMGKKWMWLAVFFSVVGFFGATPVFQTNQLVTVLKTILPIPEIGNNPMYLDAILGLVIAGLVALVITGGVKRIGKVASGLIPFVVVLFVVCVMFIVAVNYQLLIPSLLLIFKDAFTAKAVLGGALHAMILEGAKRAAFSNESGIGNAPMMHGAAKTNQPIREGLVAMLGPAIDTLLVCSMTGIALLVTGVWNQGGQDGILMTLAAFKVSFPQEIGAYLLALCVLVFAITTIFGLAYYGKKCLSFLVGVKYASYFDYWYIGLVVVGSVASLADVVNLIFIAYGLMAFPTMISGIYLAPKVMYHTKNYFQTLKK